MMATTFCADGVSVRVHGLRRMNSFCRARISLSSLTRFRHERSADQMAAGRPASCRLTVSPMNEERLYTSDRSMFYEGSPPRLKCGSREWRRAYCSALKNHCKLMAHP
jgi:hypothetical protein